MRSLSFLILALLAWLQVTEAVKFSVDAKPKGSPARCIRDFVTKGKMVVVKVSTDGAKGDGQVLNLMVCTSVYNSTLY